MSTAPSTVVPCPASPASSDQAEGTACQWIEDRHDDLVRLTRHAFRHRSPDVRDEAVAECLAQSFKSAIGAARRGTLHRLTPSTCVGYATRQFRSGRRFGGCSSRCVMNEATRGRHGVRHVSLDRPVDAEGERSTTFAECLADGYAESPLEVVRRNHDYPQILKREGLSEKAQTTFAFLAEHHGGGRQLDLAATLMVSPGRITQLKAELAEALAAYGYHGPLGPRPVA